MSKKEIEKHLAARAPKPDVPDAIRKLPTPVRRPESAPPASPPTPRPPPARVEPLSPARFKIQFTADEALKDKLERARMLLSRANPTLDLAVVVERAVDLLLADLEKKKLAKTERPRRARRPNAAGTITRATRREVFARDGERCS